MDRHHRLAEAAHKAEHALAQAAETELNLPYLFPSARGPCQLVRRVTRADLDALARR